MAAAAALLLSVAAAACGNDDTDFGGSSGGAADGTPEDVLTDAGAEAGVGLERDAAADTASSDGSGSVPDGSFPEGGDATLDVRTLLAGDAARDGAEDAPPDRTGANDDPPDGAPDRTDATPEDAMTDAGSDGRGEGSIGDAASDAPAIDASDAPAIDASDAGPEDASVDGGANAVTWSIGSDLSCAAPRSSMDCHNDPDSTLSYVTTILTSQSTVCPIGASSATVWFPVGAPPSSGSYAVVAISNEIDAYDVPAGSAMIELTGFVSGVRKRWFAQTGTVTVSEMNGQLSISFDDLAASDGMTQTTISGALVCP